MGNTHNKPHPRQKNKKQVHWKAAGTLVDCFSSNSKLANSLLARPHAPGKPFLVSDAEPTPDLVTVRWPKPLSDGGSPISGYLVEHRRAGSPHWVRATPLLVQLSELTISGLEPGWRYQFRVRAENAVGISDPSELSEPITVTLQRSAVTAPRITQELQDTSALENEKAEFVVHFLGQPAPKVCWYKDAFEIFSSRRIRILTENDRSVLTIHQCSLSDEGEIKCTTTNRAGHVSTKSKLIVQAPPSVRLPRQYENGLLFEIGELIRLKVSVAGRPTPLVFWSHNGESIKNNDRYEIEYVDNSSVLKIADAQREDRGEYIVKAVNKLGEHTQSFLVTVTDKPSPPGKARVVMALGRTVTLSWNLPEDDGGCKIGNYIVEYYRLGWDVWLKAATSRQLTTMLGDLIEGSEYKFRIKAESPYGVSEPSEESEVVFIPDTKRGILQPPPRSKSQQRELIETPVTPVARKKHNKRSLSSPRATLEEKMSPISVNVASELDIPPKRPIRTKIKSPSKTPEASPLPAKKEVDTTANKRELETKLNKEIFERSDSSSMARDLAYGSPDIKVKKDLNAEAYLNSDLSNISSSSDKSNRTPSPTNKTNNHKVYKVKIETDKNHTPSPQGLRKTILSRDNSENLTGSSEFMLVLYPDENQQSQADFDLEYNLIPPPMSLSAPELGSEAPIFNIIKTSASSTELLHERVMNRLYEAAKAEERELERRRKSIELKGLNIEIPKIQINSKDQQEKIELERMHSMKRRLSSGNTQQFWTRRQSLKNAEDLKNNAFNSHLNKFNVTPNEKRTIMMSRQRSESEEMEEKVFEQVRSKMAIEKQSSLDKRKINVVEIEKWADDYVSSTEESSVEDEDEIIKSNRKLSFDETDEEPTYHPKELRSMSFTKDEPFEILTKRKDPPSPDFVPKPILKKKEVGEIPVTLPPTSPKSKRALSPIPVNIEKRNRSQSLIGTSRTLPLLQKTIPEEVTRPRSSSLTYEDYVFQTSKVSLIQKKSKRSLSLLSQTDLSQNFDFPGPTKSRQRSFSLIPLEENISTISPESIYNFEPPKTSFLMQTIAAAATISGITAASIVIPDRLVEKQKDAEEAKVVVDHYSDIVKSYGSTRKSNSSINKSRDSLQKSRDSLLKSHDSLKKIDESKETFSTENYIKKPTPTAKTSLPNNYHDNYSTYKTPQNTLNKKDNAFSSTSSAESGYISSPSPIAINVTNAGKDLSFAGVQKKFSLGENTADSIMAIKELPSLKIAAASSIDNSRLLSPTLQEKVRPFSSALDNRDIFLHTNDETNIKQFSLDSQDVRSLSPTTNSHRSSFSTLNQQKIKRQYSPTSDEQIFNSSTVKIPQVRKVSDSPKRKLEKRKTASPYPKSRKTSPSPIRLQDSASSDSSIKRKSTSLPGRSATKKLGQSPMRIKPPKLKEIMTQTSEGLESMNENYPNFLRDKKQEEIIAKAEVKVHHFVDYITDLAMLSVACWFYLFSNELFAIPVLLLLAYRQLQVQCRQLQGQCIQLKDKVYKKCPKWLVRLLGQNKPK